MFFDSNDKKHKLVIGTTAHGMSSLALGVFVKTAPNQKSFVFDKGSNALKAAAQEIAVLEEMKRRKVRFLPAQVIRRIKRRSTSLSPFV